MKVILFGATGMVGQGVLRECLLDPKVEKVLSIVRAPSSQTHAKLQEVALTNFLDYSSVVSSLVGFDACFFCLGVSSAGMKEDAYSRITCDITIAAAQAMVKASPSMTFIYVSGTGTDSTEKGRIMWARIKGKTENALFALPFKAAYMFRPGFIQPMHGIRSKTELYRLLYVVSTPLYPLFKKLAPGLVTTTEQVGRAMIQVAKTGYGKRWLENRDINQVCE